ncbi:hypothetical protein LINPERPRIM_LOCUS28101 [Linum perenne]
MLASGCTTDPLDEYFQLGESTALENLQKFCTAVVRVYGPQYLREPTREDLQKLLRKASQRGFPGIIAQSTVCTGSGGIVLLRGQGNSLVMFIDLQLCSRRLRGTTHGYGMHTSARRGHLTTSIF